MRPILLLSILAITACGRVERARQEAADSARVATLAEVERALAETVRRAGQVSRAADRVLRPLPVMTPAEEDALRRFRSGAHVASARDLGAARVARESQRDSLLATGALVQLEDSTRHWIVRPGTSPAYVVPHLRALLEVVATRFQDRLSEMGLPAYRLEVTSALRTSERQERLRRSNPNAAVGVSSHEFGATVDLSYAAFAPPAEPEVELPAGLPSGYEPSLRRIVDLSLESVSARKSRELGAIFSRVLFEVQSEGLAQIIYERQQTVYHVTVSRALAD